MGQRAPAEDGVHPARPVVDAGDDEERRAEREEEHPARVEHPPRVRPDDEEGPDAGDDADDPGADDDGPGEGRDAAVGARREPHPEGGADEERLGAGVGAVVDAGVVARVVEADHAGPHRARHTAEQQHEGDQATGADEREQPEDDEGDEDVELLLDRQGPRVAKGGGPTLRTEVLVALGDEAPVHDVGQGRQDVAADGPPHGRVGGEPCVTDDEGQDEEERRQQPSRATAVEGEHVDVAAGDFFLDEQPCDEEGGEDEEEIDGHPHARELVHPEVVGHEGEHEEAADAVERRAESEA